jgi:multiple sugar transport system permease protein
VRVRPGAAALYAGLVAGALLALGPMLWMLAASFMPAGEANSYPPRILPSRPTLEHYATLFTRLDLGRNLINSAIIAATVTALSLLINSMAGYALAKLRFRYRERVFRSLSAGLLLPVQVSMLPLFLLFKELGLVNRYWGASFRPWRVSSGSS